MVKNLPANAGDVSSIPELGKSPGYDEGTQSCCSVTTWRVEVLGGGRAAWEGGDTCSLWLIHVDRFAVCQ